MEFEQKKKSLSKFTSGERPWHELRNLVNKSPKSKYLFDLQFKRTLSRACVAHELGIIWCAKNILLTVLGSVT